MKCGDCAPEFGCWNGSQPCQKKPLAQVKPPVFAFPVPPESIPFPSAFAQSGMTLRDYFAIRFAANMQLDDCCVAPQDIADFAFARAKSAYRFADAMLAARGEEAKS